MILGKTWRLFTQYFSQMTVAGLFYTLVSYVAAGVGIVVMLPLVLVTAWTAGTALDHMDLNSSFDGARIGFLIMAYLVLILVVSLIAPIGTGGLIHAVVQAQRGQAAKAIDFWQSGFRYWVRQFLLSLLTMVVSIVFCAVVIGLICLDPLIGGIIGGILALLLGGSLCVAVGGYAPYLIVAEELTAKQAFCKAFRILRAKWGDVLLTFLMLVLYGILISIVLIPLSLIPGLGVLISLAISVFLSPLVMLYFAERYQTNIAPALPPQE